MENINLSATAARALELLSVRGMSDKGLRTYTHTGFGCIIRYFRANGINCATPKMLDEFLLKQRELFEQGMFSSWKWGLIRRGCELLKCCAAEDSVELPQMLPWLPALKQPRQSICRSTPTLEQLEDQDDIFALVWKTNQAISGFDLSETTLRHYRNEGLSVILNRHYEAGTTRFSRVILDQTVAEKRAQYEQGQCKRSTYRILRKAAYWLIEMYQTGRVTLARIPNLGQREPIEQLHSLLKEFCAHIEHNKSMAESSFNSGKSAIRTFLFEMENNGFSSLEHFTQANINACVIDFAKHYTGGLPSAMYYVRRFLRFLYEKEFISTDLSKSLPELVATRKMFREGFTKNELNILLDQPKRDTPIGKRDYAMLVLAAQSGLRACDVVRLELSNIDWRLNKIHLIQHKTGQPLSLPLESESGNAIADYILNGRPNSLLPNIFLCHVRPIRPLKSRTASGIVSKHMRKAGLPPEHRAFHALRRTFGTRLLQSEVSFELIQQLLGHRNMNSMKPYLSIDEQGLKQCALPLITCGKDGG